MPKVEGRRRGASPSHNENPDMIGVVVARRQAMPTVGVDVPFWLGSNAKRELVTTIGAEVKPVIASGNNLYWAVVEARHNSRYFDEAWLVSQIPSEHHADARDLGEEYNVGILSWRAGMQSDVLWSPLRRAGTRTIGDFFSRFDRQQAETRIAELRRCHELAVELPHTLRRAALEQLVSNQVAVSMLKRLPASVQQGLGASTPGQDVEAYCQALVDLFLEAYQHDSGEDATIDHYWRELGLLDALRKNADLVTPRAAEKVKQLLQSALDEQTSDHEAVRSAFADR
jgi:hypothetical protein